ncbi:enterochelin esterase domain-containing protein, partial [Winslowiella iniecta]
MSINPIKPVQPEGTAAGLLAAADAGQPQWWQQLAQLGTPLIEPAGNSEVKMNYFWRDPTGTAQQSAIVRVYIDINGITDHHSRTPQSLQRLAGTDIWYWSTTVDARWRGSYSLIPIDASQLPPAFSADDNLASQQQREW